MFPNLPVFLFRGETAGTSTFQLYHTGLIKPAAAALAENTNVYAPSIATIIRGSFSASANPDGLSTDPLLKFPFISTDANLLKYIDNMFTAKSYLQITPAYIQNTFRIAGRALYDLGGGGGTAEHTTYYAVDNNARCSENIVPGIYSIVRVDPTFELVGANTNYTFSGTSSSNVLNAGKPIIYRNPAANT